MRLTIVMENFGEVFSRCAQEIGQIVISGCDDDFAGAVIMDPTGAVGGGDSKVPVFPSHRLYPLVLEDVQAVMLGNASIVFERFLARGLLVGSVEGDVANFQQLGRGEE